MNEADRFWGRYGHRLSNDYGAHVRSVSSGEDGAVTTLEWRGPLPRSLRALIGAELERGSARLVRFHPDSQEYILRRLQDQLDSRRIANDVFESIRVYEMTGSLVMVLVPPVANQSAAVDLVERIASEYDVTIDVVVAGNG